jgi:magnesium chelatase family protein
MQGPPGTGKTMLASRIPGIMPQLGAREAVEVASIYSISSLPNPNPRIPPFRSPHHTCSQVALVGGGSKPAPGEISLAHNGVLFLDELPEFPSRVLEVLRQPMESGEVSVSRAAFKARFPARFQLIAAMNPCPCGYLGETRCRCSPDRVAQYQGRVSGPLLDRIDMHIRLRRTRQEINLAADTRSDTSERIRERVALSQKRQLERQGTFNSGLAGARIQAMLKENPVLAETAQLAIDQMDLSMRAIHRILRVAQTIADLDNQSLGKPQLLEALDFRQQMGTKSPWV